MNVYVNADHIVECINEARQNTQFNDSPSVDRALLMVMEFVWKASRHPLMTDSFTVGECEGCIYKGKRPQRCSCCRENPRLTTKYNNIGWYPNENPETRQG